MDRKYGFDDEHTEALLSRAGHDFDPRLAGVLDDFFATFTVAPPPLSPTLEALIRSGTQPAIETSPKKVRQRRLIVAKAAAAIAAVVAGTGGLAAAGALPGPMQDVFSQIGIGRPAGGSHHHHVTGATGDADSTTTTVMSTTTTVHDDHGSDVRNAARDSATDGCEHGHAVANIASDGRSNGRPCVTTPTTSAHRPSTNEKVDNAHANDAPNKNDIGSDVSSGDDQGPPANTAPTGDERSGRNRGRGAGGD